MSVCVEHNNYENTLCHIQNNVSQNVSVSKRSLAIITSDVTTSDINVSGFSKWNIFKIIKLWNSRIRQRRDLASLDERLLADIAYTRAQAREEYTKPFWK